MNRTPGSTSASSELSLALTSSRDVSRTNRTNEVHVTPGNRKRDRDVISDIFSFENANDAGELPANSQMFPGFSWASCSRSSPLSRWFFGTLSRFQAQRFLLEPENEEGAFLIRVSEKDDVGHVLSGKNPNTRVFSPEWRQHRWSTLVLQRLPDPEIRRIQILGVTMATAVSITHWTVENV